MKAKKKAKRTVRKRRKVASKREKARKRARKIPEKIPAEFAEDQQEAEERRVYFGRPRHELGAEPSYLGEDVYVRFDGFYVELIRCNDRGLMKSYKPGDSTRLNRGPGFAKVNLSTQVLQAFDRWRTSIPALLTPYRVTSDRVEALTSELDSLRAKYGDAIDLKRALEELVPGEGDVFDRIKARLGLER